MQEIATKTALTNRAQETRESFDTGGEGLLGQFLGEALKQGIESAQSPNVIGIQGTASDGQPLKQPRYALGHESIRVSQPICFPFSTGRVCISSHTLASVHKPAYTQDAAYENAANIVARKGLNENEMRAGKKVLGRPRKAFAGLDGNNLRPTKSRNNARRYHANRLNENPFLSPQIESGPDGTVYGRKPAASTVTDSGSGSIGKSISPDFSNLDAVCPYAGCTQNLSCMSEQAKSEHMMIHASGSLEEDDLNGIMHTLGCLDVPSNRTEMQSHCSSPLALLSDANTPPSSEMKDINLLRDSKKLIKAAIKSKYQGKLPKEGKFTLNFMYRGLS